MKNSMMESQNWCLKISNNRNGSLTSVKKGTDSKTSNRETVSDFLNGRKGVVFAPIYKEVLVSLAYLLQTGWHELTLEMTNSDIIILNRLD